MSRSSVALRAARAEDAEFLAELWSVSLRRADHHEQVCDAEVIIKAASASAEQRLVVAEYDGSPAGAVLVRLDTISPINLDPSVQVLALQVAPAFRRHGIGRTLMECAVAFAEESGIPHVTVGVSSGSRDANRFMARLALGPLATFRVAPTAAVRARLTAQRPAMSTTSTSGRHLTRVLAARRSMRRSQAPSSTG